VALPLKLQAQLIHAGLSADACCYDGIKALLQKKPRKAQKAVTFNPKLEEEEVEDLDCESAEVLKLVPGQYCLQDDHPNFTGTWKCVKAEGAIDELFTAMGMSYMRRKASAAFGHGVGAATREYLHSGDNVKMVQKILDENVQEWVIGNEEQEVQGTFQKHLLASYWDPDNALVLVIEGKDLRRAKPTTWTTTRQFFLDEDHMVLETSADGHAASWTFERQTV